MKLDLLTNGDCCFNHIVGLPQKAGADKPLYDYEQLIFDSLAAQKGSDNKKHLWIKKATGLGVSEFMLRFMAWLCLKDSKLSGSQMCIVTGPRIDLAIALIDRMKKLFAGYEDCSCQFQFRK
jgi:late competence protein required for DNA uptake (superfamily II DNA/RNA helicase)